MEYDDVALGEMLAPRARDVTTIARMQSGDQLLITACGRTCSIDMRYSRSIVELQGALQRTLQMEGQAFHILDMNGQLLSTDMQVHDAIVQGLTPLSATLPDKSLHHLENRREELAQMQWKLVRDQMTQSTNQMTQLARQLSDLQFNLQSHQRECECNFELLRGEMNKAIAMERVTTKAEIQPVQEAVNGAVLLINSERGKRELSVQGFEKHIHGLCDMLDNERASRRQEMSEHSVKVQEIKSALESERSARDVVEDMVKDLKLKIMHLREECSNGLQESREQLRRVQADANTTITDSMSRFSEIEDRCASIENNLNDSNMFNTESLDKLNERQERATQGVESLRMNTKLHEGSIANALERVKELEGYIRQYDMDVRDQFQREKTVRDDSIRRVQQTFNNDCKKQIGDMEKRLTVRLERESAEREKNFRSIIDELGTLMKERKPASSLAQLGKFSETPSAPKPTLQTSPSAKMVTEDIPVQTSFIVGSADGTSEFPLMATPADSFQPENAYAPSDETLNPVGIVHERVPSVASFPKASGIVTQTPRAVGTGYVTQSPVAQVRPAGYPKAFGQAISGGTASAGTVPAMSVSSVMGGSLQAPSSYTLSPRLGTAPRVAGSAAVLSSATQRIV